MVEKIIKLGLYKNLKSNWFFNWVVLGFFGRFVCFDWIFLNQTVVLSCGYYTWLLHFT